MASSRRHPRIFVGVLSMFVPAIIFHNIWVSRKAVMVQSVLPRNKTSAETPVLPPTKDTLFYYHNPENFVKKFSDCLFEGDRCHVLYWHVQKTGGSYLASRLYPIFNLGKFYNSRAWCCNDKFMKHEFWPNVTTYCSKQLGVYEVRAEEYLEVIQACQGFREKEENNATETGRHRYIGLISVREPIQRSVSAIHQKCNVHSGKLDQNAHQICERCSYDEEGADKPFYEKIVNETNAVYSGMKNNILSDPNLDIPLYIIDNEHINDFFGKLEDDINLRAIGAARHFNRTFHFPQGKSNSENPHKLCDFGMPSELMRQHRASLQVYHWLWSGDYLWRE